MNSSTDMSNAQVEYTPEQLREITFERVKKYDDFDFPHKYAMYMGLAQLLELRLKQIAVRDFDQDFDDIERTTLGAMIGILEKKGIRGDFVAMLRPINDSRNHIAHDLLVNDYMFRSLTDVPDKHYSKAERFLDRSIYNLEQCMFIIEVTEESGTWR